MNPHIPDLKILIHSIVMLAFLCGTSAFSDDHDYEYPILDALAATVVGTPEKYQADLGEPVFFEKHKFKVFDDRKTPDYFWYNDKITYGVMRQDKKAPLIFIIAGTGGNYSGPKNLAIARALYNEGFHVVSLPSPTYMSFIIAASKTTVPGLLDDDSHDLYNVMKLAWQIDLQNEIEVSDFYITGYSLGGAQAAYISYIDDKQEFFNFKKVLVMNSPVSLLNSVKILDGYVDESFTRDQLGKHFNQFWQETWGLLSKRYSESPTNKIQLGPDFLFELYKDHDINDEKFQALIGTAFRISAASLIFTSDVMSQSGYIVPKGETLRITDDVSSYSAISHRTSFTEYAKELMLPYYQAQDPGITFDDLVERASLYPIEDYLRNSEKVGLIHNQDDIIMAPGEIDWFRGVFGDRAQIYPTGGHLGNVVYKDNIEYLIAFFKD
jgi:hypothetical protein